jgi:hypothetical protein
MVEQTANDVTGERKRQSRHDLLTWHKHGITWKGYLLIVWAWCVLVVRLWHMLDIHDGGFRRASACLIYN